MNAILSPFSRPFIDASSGPDLGQRPNADAGDGAFGRLMRRQDTESAESKTAPRGGSSGSVPARSAARTSARDDSTSDDPGSPALADFENAPDAAESASDSPSDVVRDTQTPLKKAAKGALPVDAATGADPGPAPTVPVYLIAIGATAESGADASASGDLAVAAAAGANPDPASAVRSSHVAMTESMQPTAGADPQSQGASSSDGRAASESGGLPVAAAAGASPGPAPAVRSPSLAIGEATDAMQPTSGADPKSQGASSSSDGRTDPLQRTVARAASESGSLPVAAAAGTSPGPVLTLRSSPLATGEATDAMPPTTDADPQSQGASPSDGRAAQLPPTMARAAPVGGSLPVDTASNPAPALRSSPLAIGEATDAMPPRSGADAKDPDGPKPASTLEVGSISAQIQRLMHAGADPVRTDGLGLVAPPGANTTSQLNAVGTTPPPTVQMGTPAGAHGWEDKLAQRVLWLAGQRGGVAELRLDPPELGSLEIRIRQKKDATSVSFVVQSSSAREAVESALPRLREFFAEAGLSLQSMDVSERQSGERGDDAGDRSTGGDTGLAEGRFAGGEPSPRTLWRGGGLIDTYA